jgi:hypothetical protein
VTPRLLLLSPLCTFAACGPDAPPTITSAWSESGAVSLRLSSDTVSLGRDTLSLTAEDAGGGGLVGLSLEIEATMPDMGHSEGAVEIVEEGGGVYQLTTEVDMTGLWVLDGVIVGAPDDPFLLAVEAW